MIVEYYRPRTIDETLDLLKKVDPAPKPMGGGTILNQPGVEQYVVVDLQGLGLNKLEKQGNLLIAGATVTLQDLINSPDVPEVVKTCAYQETNFNLRQIGTLAGTLVSANGRSPLTTLLLALEAHVIWMPDEKETNLGEWLPLRSKKSPGKLITSIKIPMQAKASFQAVKRTPSDWPIVCAAVVRWSSGRTRLALGGFGDAPVVALDGPEPGGLEASARDAYSQAWDQWASAEYRQEMAAILAKRCFQEVERG